MSDKPPSSSIVRTTYRYKRPPKRKHPVEIQQRIVSAKMPKPGPAAPAINEVVTERKRQPAQPAAITGPRIVTAPKARGRFGDVSDMTPEEHQRRGDAAEALFAELVRRVNAADE